MSERMKSMPDVTREAEKIRTFDVATINHRLNTIDELKNAVEALARDGRLDTIVAMEFSLEIRYAIDHIHELKALAKQTGSDVILAPSGSIAGEKAPSWGELKKALQAAGATTEETNYPEDRSTTSVGLFVSKNGDVFAFPKYSETPVHRVPNTRIGVTICGEINDIRPEHLHNIDILYNPSEEYDDGLIAFRLAQTQKGLPLTRNEVESLLLQGGEELRNLFLSDEEYAKHRKKINEELRQQLGSEHYEELFGNEPLIAEYEEPAARREKAEHWIERILHELSENKESIYVPKANGVREILQQRRILIIRADVWQSAGILNEVPEMKVEKVEIKPKSTRIRFSVKKR